MKKKADYEVTFETKSGEQKLKFMEALKFFIARDDSVITWVKRKDALCFMRFVVDRIPNPLS